jgi:tetratricopeptide (TPR) repeat protein
MSNSPTHDGAPERTPELPGDLLDSLFEPSSGSDSQLHLEPDSIFPPGPAPTQPGFPEPLRTVAGSTEINTGPTRAPNHHSHGVRLIAGRYRLGSEIARGGMGAVLRAVDEYFDREIAIKLLLADPQTDPAAVARFHAEARVTANLQHPGIPPVHDMGVTPNGRPFLVMKLIKGRTFAEYLYERESPQHELPRWVRVFGQIAQTVGYAHSRGLIHRDLKPLNVMVGAFGEVQVMDWGLAKPVAHPDSPALNPVTADSFADTRTQAGWVLGTPAYMAPEQARGESDKIDSRTDVFALGIMLTEILIGETPYRGNTPQDVVKQAANADLEETFQRLQACGADRDLVAIAQMCLAENPEQRPHDGAVVADLVNAYQAEVENRLRLTETQRARTETQLAEQRKRRRVWLGLTVVFLLGTVVSTALALLAEQSRQEAENARKGEAAAADAERLARKAADEAYIGTKAALDRAKEAEENTNAFSRFLVTRILAACRPEGIEEGLGVDVTMSEALRAAEARFDDVFHGKPLAEAEARIAIGVTWVDLGRFREAENQFRVAAGLRLKYLGGNHPKTIAAEQSYARSLSLNGKDSQSLEVYKRVRDALVHRHGPDHPESLYARQEYAASLHANGKKQDGLDELKLVRDASVQSGGATSPAALRATLQLAQLYSAQTITTFDSKATADVNLIEAIRLFEQVRDGYASIRTRDHPIVLQIDRQLAFAYLRAKRMEPATELAESAFSGLERRYQLSHPETLAAANVLAAVYARTHRQDDAIELLERSIAAGAKRLGPDHRAVMGLQATLADTYGQAQRHSDAARVWGQLVQHSRALLGVDHPTTLANTQDWIRSLEVSEQWQEAADLRLILLDSQQKKFGPERPERALVFFRTGRALLYSNRPVEAEPYLREALILREKLLPMKKVSLEDVAESRELLGESLYRQGRFADAEPLLLEAYATWKFRFKPQNDKQRRFLEQHQIDSADLALSLYRALGKAERIDFWTRERVKYPPSPAPKPREVKR